MSTAPDVRQLLEGIVEPPAHLAAKVPNGLSLDSRRVEPGTGFVALAGGREHGLAHAGQALARGASCILYEAPAPAEWAERIGDWPGIAVPQLRARLGTLAERVYDAPSQQQQVVGVTGTNGKTSTVYLLAQALDRAGVDVASIGTLGSGRPGALVAGERTTPDVLAVHALLRRYLDAGIRHVAMEVSSHALDQGRVDHVRFAIAVFTNLSRDHLDYHGDMDRYGEVKARLFRWPGLHAAVINTDDAFGRQLAGRLPAGVRRLCCGLRRLDDDAWPDVHARDVRPTDDGLRFTLITPQGEAAIATGLLGRFNVANLLGVAACLDVFGWSLPDIAGALGAATSVPGRMNRYGGGMQPLVVVDYAHTPDALEQTLSSLRDHARADLVCVFGCGGERDAGKRPQMARVAERLADRLVVTDDNPRGEDGDAIVADILAGLRQPPAVVVQRDRAHAIADAVAAARPGDIVVIAGKGHETYQEIGGQRLPFDDRAHVQAALERWTC